MTRDPLQYPEADVFTDDATVQELIISRFLVGRHSAIYQQQNPMHPTLVEGDEGYGFQTLDSRTISRGPDTVSYSNVQTKRIANYSSCIRRTPLYRAIDFKVANRQLFATQYLLRSFFLQESCIYALNLKLTAPIKRKISSPYSTRF